ncbi:AmmeMemoRadiSam system protein A [Natranaerofaba carboxydovora]|uniref:AmmeMemoRadiSam system protein A n=1 Tax=Natranaerofaba carboxydovora TaxID=2742683 RepID=UPI001F147162|nr:AmmeMemoRadiSam system protein A [Natranaerofaba carboxydovora]UMZ75432.1 hypothetical protein ACONDI_03060 [Natranaerofaba carboxydovora]
MSNNKEIAIKLARDSLKTYLKENKILSLLPDMPEDFLKRAGCFVSLKKEDGSLRGCIGTIEPVYDTLAEEIIRNSISAGTKDPRFPKVEIIELDSLVFAVDVLHPKEEITDFDYLDPYKYGVVVEKGRQKGVLLPDLEGIDTAQKQVEIAMTKASINDINGTKIYRFKVERYNE